VGVSYTATESEHEALAPFLEHMGFVPEDDHGENIFVFTLSQAAESAFFDGSSEESVSVLPFSKLPAASLSVADRKARAQDAVMPGKPLAGDAFDKEISVALLKGAEVVAFLAFDKSCCGLPTISCAWVGEGGGSVAMRTMLRAAFRMASKKYPSDAEFAVQTVGEITAKLVQALLPTARSVSRSYYRPLNG
jgi:hypothetical protein